MSINPTEIFTQAISEVNGSLQNEQVVRVSFELQDGKYVKSVATSNEVKDPKFPIWIGLQSDKGLEPIGITHVVQLEGKDWDNTSWEKLARTVDQCVAAIKTQIESHKKAMQDSSIVISDRGTKFDFQGHPFAVEGTSKMLHVNDKPVLDQNEPISINHLHSEGVISFSKRDDGNYELQDSVDLREEKGMFISPDGNYFRL